MKFFYTTWLRRALVVCGIQVHKCAMSYHCQSEVIKTSLSPSSKHKHFALHLVKMTYYLAK